MQSSYSSKSHMLGLTIILTYIPTFVSASIFLPNNFSSFRKRAAELTQPSISQDVNAEISTSFN